MTLWRVGTTFAAKSTGVTQLVAASAAPIVCTQPHPRSNTAERASKVTAAIKLAFATLRERRHIDVAPPGDVHAIANTPMSPGILIAPAKAQRTIPHVG